MNALLGVQIFGVRQVKVALTKLSKTQCSLFKKYRSTNSRSLHTSTQSFARRVNDARTTAIAQKPKSKAGKSANAESSSRHQQAIEGPKGYLFPIVAGDNGLEWHSLQLDKWGVSPPFLARHNALFTLLCNAYGSLYTSTKPIVTVATTTPGFGKTRILVEWIVQVFRHPFIIGSFLADLPTLDESINADVEEQIEIALTSGTEDQKKRANFLLRLFDAGTSASIITVHADRANVEIIRALEGVTRATEQQVHEICKAILISGITSRFETDRDGLNTMNIAMLAQHFVSLARGNTSWPNFANQTERPMPLLVINIDEIQGFVIQTTATGKNLACAIVKELLGHLRRHTFIINMVGSLSDDNLLTNCQVGLRMGQLSKFRDDSKFFLVPYLPLDPLLQRKYLSEVCDKVLKKKLYSADAGTLHSRQNSFTKELSTQLHELWVSSSGIPRAIENLVMLLKDLNLANKDELTTAEIEPLRKLMARAKFTLNDIRNEIDGNLAEKKWNALLLDFVFCIAKESTSQVLGKKTRYEDLEAAGLIIPFHFQQPTSQTVAQQVNEPRQYTIPFSLLSKETAQVAIPAYQGSVQNEVNPHNIVREKFTIILESALKVYGRSRINEEATEKANTVIFHANNPMNDASMILEEATAASLWLRYLCATALLKGALMPMEVVLPDFKQLNNFYASWRAVIRLTTQGLSFKAIDENKPKQMAKHENFDKFVEFLSVNQYIAVNVVNAQFANVIAPLYDKLGKFSKLLCIQCRNVQADCSKVQLGNLHLQMKYILGEENLIVMVLSPNFADNTSLAQLSTVNTQKLDLKQWEAANVLFASNGKNLLSDWFLRVFSDSFFEQQETL